MKKLNFLNKMFWLLLATGLTTAVFNSCGGDESDEPGQTLTVTSVSLNKTTLALAIGSSETLIATVLPDNATNRTVTWTSSASAVATVDANGKVTAVTAGTATITAKAGDKTATCTVTVSTNIVAVTSISLNKTTLTLAIGNSETLIATVLPDNATDRTVTWTSSVSAVATVDANGKVTAVTAGTATITAKAGDKTATCVITVNSAPVITPTTDPGVVINGIKWATRNVDAPGTFAATPESAGKFYQWNRNVAWNATGTVTGWDSSYPTGTVWTRANDPSPAGWRVPTSAEQQTLLDSSKVTSVWTTQNGVTGRKFTDIATGNSLFLPAVGNRGSSNGALNGAGANGLYWGSTQYDSGTAYSLGFTSSLASWGNYNRYTGISVRAVTE